MSPKRKYSDREILRRLAGETRSCRIQIIALLVISLFGMPMTLLTPLPLKLAVDCISGTHALPQWMKNAGAAGEPGTTGRTLAWIAGLVVVIAVVKQVSDLAFSVLRSYTGEKLVLNFRAKLFRHTQNLSLSYHDARGSADSTYRIQYDAPAIQWIAIDAAIPLITAIFTLLCMMVVMARIDWMLAAVAMTITPLLFGLSQIYTKRMKVHWRDLKNLESSSLGVVQEVLSSVRVVKAFAQEDREHRRYLEHAGKNLREQWRLALTGGSYSLIVGVLMAIGTGAVLFLGARHVQAGALTLGSFILMMSYLGLLYGPLQTLSKSAASLQGSLVSMERALSLLDHAPDVVEKAQARPLTRARGHVAFQHVGFFYNPDRPALEDITFEVQAGSTVGIAGTTGAGKSTLVSLLLRLYDPVQGQITLDHVDLRDYKLRDLRNQFAIVLQEPVLFSSSIGENIAYARPEAGMEEIIEAAKAANAHDFISRLAKGYDTPVGERGVQLSGGERQRISLARAFLKNAPILILDEPTSSVDVKTEAVILEAMERLMRGRTSFMIAHRLATLDICNVRLHLEKGRLISAKDQIAKSQQSLAAH